MTLIRTVAEHLAKQRKQSNGQHPDGHGCSYRGEDGTMCAIGCLIPDELYTFDMEGRAFDDLDHHPDVFNHVTNLWKKEHPNDTELETVNALMVIQGYHDYKYVHDYQEAKHQGLTDEQFADQIENDLLNNVHEMIVFVKEDDRWI